MKSPEGIFKKIAPLICHATWCAYQQGIGGESNETPTKAQFASLEVSVGHFLKSPKRTPEESHALWMKHKQESGWKHGEAKDEINKTHPCMVPFDQLPEKERKKDEVHIQSLRFAWKLAYFINDRLI